MIVADSMCEPLKPNIPLFCGFTGGGKNFYNIVVAFFNGAFHCCLTVRFKAARIITRLTACIMLGSFPPFCYYRFAYLRCWASTLIVYILVLYPDSVSELACEFAPELAMQKRLGSPHTGPSPPSYKVVANGFS